MQLMSGQPSAASCVIVTMVTRNTCWSALILVTLSMVASPSLFAQNGNVGINTTGTAPRPVAVLDMVEPTKGLLIPRIPLVATNVAAPVPSPANLLLVYNTEKSALIGVDAQYNVSPGFYAWDANGSRWTRFAMLPRRPEFYVNSALFVSTGATPAVVPGLASMSMYLLGGDRVDLSSTGTLFMAAAAGHAEAFVELSVDEGSGYGPLPNGTGRMGLTVEDDVTTVNGNSLTKPFGRNPWGCFGYYEVSADGLYTFAVRIMRTAGTAEVRLPAPVPSQGLLPATLKVEVVRP